MIAKAGRKERVDSELSSEIGNVFACQAWRSMQ